jgi:predicted anti-sigma-YlaC factor YlaD
MKHDQFQELVSLFIDRELEAGREQELFGHLESCGECRGFLRESVRLQADLMASKMSVTVQKRVAGVPAYASDRAALAAANKQTKYAGVRTFALLALVVLLAGMFWSTTLPSQTDDNPKVQQEISAEASSGQQR